MSRYDNLRKKYYREVTGEGKDMYGNPMPRSISKQDTELSYNKVVPQDGTAPAVTEEEWNNMTDERKRSYIDWYKQHGWGGNQAVYVGNTTADPAKIIDQKTLNVTQNTYNPEMGQPVEEIKQSVEVISKTSAKLGIFAQITSNLEYYFRLIFENAAELFSIIIRNIKSLPDALVSGEFFKILGKNFGSVGTMLKNLYTDITAQMKAVISQNPMIASVGAALCVGGLGMIVYNYYQSKQLTMEGKKLLKNNRYPFKEAKVYKVKTNYMREGFELSSAMDNFINSFKRTMLSFYDMFVKTVTDTNYATIGYVMIAMGVGTLAYAVLTTSPVAMA